MSTAECALESKRLTTRQAADLIRATHGNLEKHDQYEFVHKYISLGGVLEPLYMAVGESHVKESKQYIIQKILNM
jgi:hypothetical protein